MPPKGAESCPSKLLQVVDCTDRATHFWLNMSRQEGIRSENTKSVHKNFPLVVLRLNLWERLEDVGPGPNFTTSVGRGGGSRVLLLSNTIRLRLPKP